MVTHLAVVTGGWLLHRAGLPERVLCLCAALFLLYLQPLSVAIGVAFLIAALIVHLVGERSFGAKPSQSTGTG